MSQFVERTAIGVFELAGKPVRVGQVVTLDPIQFERAWKAGVVHRGATENASAPKDDVPGGYGSAASFEADIKDAASTAASQIEALRASVDDVRTKSDAEIAGHRQRVTDAGAEADTEIAGHRERVAAELARLDRELEAKRKALEETPPASSGDVPPEASAEGDKAKAGKKG